MLEVLDMRVAVAVVWVSPAGTLAAITAVAAVAGAVALGYPRTLRVALRAVLGL
jgi:hypothetical protein